jgi:hypothetical protein
VIFLPLAKGERMFPSDATGAILRRFDPRLRAFPVPAPDQRWAPATQTLFLAASGGVVRATEEWCWHAPTYRRAAAADT